jgi:predicted RNA methylase
VEHREHGHVRPLGWLGMSATGRIKSLSEPLAPPAGCHYPEGTSLRVVTRTVRAKNDFYETPAWAVTGILPKILPPSFDDAVPIVVDAGAGTGAISAVIAAYNPRAEVIGVEKDPELVEKARARGLYSAEFIQANFLKWEPVVAPTHVIMNPPYSYAMQFVQHAQKIVRRGGVVTALLRLSFLASKQRREFFATHPANVYVLTKRPSFTGKGTDACDYAWFTWQAGEGGRLFQINYDDTSRRRPRAQRSTPEAG